MKFANRAKMTTSTTGVGDLTLVSPTLGYQSFSAAGLISGDTIRYVIEDGANWEIGTGTYTSNALSRGFESSSTGSILSLSGNATVLITVTAEDFANLIQLVNDYTNSAPLTLKGNILAYSNTTVDLTGTQATTLLDIFTPSLKGLVPPSGNTVGTFLRSDGVWSPVAAGANTVNISVSGDIFGTGTSNNIILTLQTVNSTAGTFGSSNNTVSITVDNKGRIISISNNNIIISSNAVTGLSNVAKTGVFSDILNKPNTLSGYGITDGITATAVSTGYQPLDSDLTAIAALSVIDGSFLRANTSSWSTNTLSQVKTDLGLSGTNTGDQIIALVGDVTGSGNTTFSTTLSTVNFNIGSFGNTSSVSSFTVDSKGRITSANTIAIAIQSTAITDSTIAGRNFITAANTTVQTALLNPFTITLQGLTPASGGGTTNYLRADGTWASPPGGGGSLSDGDKGDIIVSGSGTIWSIDYTAVNATIAPTWSNITSKPTTISGYGITNAVTLTGAQTISGPKTFSDEIDLTIQVSDPVVATAGNTRIFAKKWAEAAVPAFRGPNGGALPLQRALWQGNVGFATAVVNNTTMSTMGFMAITATGTAVLNSVTTTSPYTRTKLVTYVSAATAGSIGGARNSIKSIATSDGAGFGGFFWNCKFGCGDAATVAGARQFVGVGSNGAPTNVEPNTLLYSIGVGHGAADTNLLMYCGGSSAQTPVDLGVNFPANTLSSDIYELTLHAPSNATGVIYWQVDRVGTPYKASGSFSGDGTVIPTAPQTVSALQAWRCNNTTALAVSLDISHIYVHTDN